MEFSGYLAMTGVEIHAMEKISGKIAWLSCHFSPYSTGISGVPSSLPPGAMLILTDRTPVCGHDPERVAQQLADAVQRLQCGCVLLDLQREGNEEAQRIAREVVQHLPCPVGVSEAYAQAMDCPVLVSPPPLWTPLQEHIAPWTGREIWLEAATEDAVVTLTEAGSRYDICGQTGPFPFRDESLQIAYRVETAPDGVLFYLHRGESELEALMEQAKALGIETTVGLYQQLGNFLSGLN